MDIKEDEEGSAIIPTQCCPWCTAPFDRATNIESSIPKPGDISICLRCANPCIFEDNYVLRKPTDDETAILDLDPEVQKYIRAAIKMNMGTLC